LDPLNIITKQSTNLPLLGTFTTEKKGKDPHPLEAQNKGGKPYFHKENLDGHTR